MKALPVVSFCLLLFSCSQKDPSESGLKDLGKKAVPTPPSFDLSTIDLAMNYKLLDLLQLRSRHSIDDIQRMGLLEKLLRTEEKMIEDLENASIVLKPYGVGYEALRELIERRINEQA